MEVTINLNNIPKFLYLIRKAINKGMSDKEITECILEVIKKGI